ncbi:phosphoribosylamine--glycine ligase [Marininema mesophilum]|uniref:Phosphoribosylamine--glycine ligase n=1 Tax=Marininema mesophilum TaxID=1048340 RepID=A0A1H2YWQ3_9BACL|nr:phosphoribosylamine--glycine ligase [Marininema mesophilum]SDX09465.1 phosphoribosylamine--glycine ligase [Marininema mesophilum]
MRVLVIGSGGREHALVWKLKQSPQVTELYCAPGNSGIGQIAECIPQLSATDVEGLQAFAEEKSIDLTVVGPEDSLLAGVVDAFTSRGLAIFGPNQAAAQVEGSKKFAKELMEKYEIPTGAYRAFTQAEEALKYVREQGAPIVIKADGLAAGKGVTVAHSINEAEKAIHEIMDQRAFGEAGAQIVVEEYLTGQEISLMAFVDGETVRPMVIAQDHKPVFAGDQGPNTGGMGAYSPVPQISDHVVTEAIEKILIPMARGIATEGIYYIGVLYAGLMVTEEGPKVIEFNARFGDPETQVVLPRLENDLLDVLIATIHGELHSTKLSWKDESAVCVVQASSGYPGPYRKGDVITGLEQEAKDSIIFHSGTALKDDEWKTAGGRVLGITALGADLAHARDAAYQRAMNIRFEGVHYRRDIGAKAAEQ